MAKTRVVVVGIDGGTWTLLKPLAEEGKMPNLRRLMKKGAWGTLHSTIPPVTGPAWVSFATGKTPEHHGVYDFFKFVDGTYKTKLITSNDISSETVFEIASDAGKRVIVINLPLSYPPKRVNGIYVSDWLAPEPYIFPEEKKEYIKGYRSYRNLDLKGEKAIIDIIDLVNLKKNTAIKLIENEPWDVFFLLFSASDWCSHLFWRDMRKGTKLGKKAEDVFVAIDNAIGEIVTRLKKDDIFFLVSDHGFEDVNKIFMMNDWLEIQGFLKTTWEPYWYDYKTSGEIVIEQSQHEKRLDSPQFRSLIENLLKNKFTKSVLILINLMLKHMLSKLKFIKLKVPLKNTIDFRETWAFMPTSESFGVYINSKNRFYDAPVGSKEEYDNFIKKLVTALKKTEFVDDAYPNPDPKMGPDILIIPKKGIMVSSYLHGLRQRIELIVNSEMGYHSPEGIVLAFGCDIKKGATIGGNIYDIAPTLLHIMGLPIPKDMDGRVLSEIFEAKSPFNVPPSYVDDIEKVRIRSRIAQLKWKLSGRE